MIIVFDVIDDIFFYKLPKDLVKKIYGYYNENHCVKCLKDCNSCDFCKDQRKGDYYCSCCCSCSICWNDGWKIWLESHSDIVLEKSPSPSPIPPAGITIISFLEAGMNGLMVDI